MRWVDVDTAFVMHSVVTGENHQSDKIHVSKSGDQEEAFVELRE